MHLEVDFGLLSSAFDRTPPRNSLARNLDDADAARRRRRRGGVAMSSWFVIDAPDAMLIATVKNGGLLLCQR